MGFLVVVRRLRGRGQQQQQKQKRRHEAPGETWPRIRAHSGPKEPCCTGGIGQKGLAPPLCGPTDLPELNRIVHHHRVGLFFVVGREAANLHASRVPSGSLVHARLAALQLQLPVAELHRPKLHQRNARTWARFEERGGHQQRRASLGSRAPQGCGKTPEVVIWRNPRCDVAVSPKRIAVEDSWARQGATLQ